MNINSVSSNPILNNPTFNKTQTRELPADQAQDTPVRTGLAESATESILKEDNVSLSGSFQTRHSEQVQATPSNISSSDAAQMAGHLKDMLNNNPSQAMQAFGIPDNRMVQSLLSAA